jgi:hypothetical protein
MSTPYAPVKGEGAGGPEAAADGVADRDADAVEGDLVAAVPGRLQAPASTRAIAPSAEARSRVFIDKGNATIPIGLRFRYHPAPEAGSPTLTPRAWLEGVAVDGG